MSRYNVRDLIGHFVKPRSAAQKMCPHPCCRNKRVHPDNFPVILPDKLLRRVSDADLEKQLDRRMNNDRARAQVIHEIERRETAARQRAHSARRAADRRRSRVLECQENLEGWWISAAATRGHMLNKKGRARGVSERSLLSDERQLIRYGSPELLNYVHAHPPPTRRRASTRAASRLGNYYSGLY